MRGAIRACASQMSFHVGGWYAVCSTGDVVLIGNTLSHTAQGAKVDATVNSSAIPGQSGRATELAVV
jgi:hypothetical protein